MSERTDIVRYYLISNELGRQLIGEVKNFRDVAGDKYTLEDEGYFSVTKAGKVTAYEVAYEYLLGAQKRYGPTIRIRFQEQRKNDLTFEQDWEVVSDQLINMYTLSFDEESDNPSVDFEFKDINKLINDNFDTEFDVQGEGVPELAYKTLAVKPRQILKRSRFIGTGAEINAKDDQGSTARAILLELDYTSQSEIIGEVSTSFANSVNDNYAQLAFAGATFLTNALQDFTYTLNGVVEIQVSSRALNGDWRIDLVRYNNELQQSFDEVILNLGTPDPASQNSIFRYEFNNYQFDVAKGDSIGLMSLSNTSDFGGLDFKFTVTENTELRLETDTPFPETSTKAVKPLDMFQHLARIINQDIDYKAISDIFGPGGRHENKLLVHGTWLRNAPVIINEGLEDERRLQANLSMEQLYDALQILEPLRRDVQDFEGDEVFTVGAFKQMRQRFVGIELGEVTDKFRLVEVGDKNRETLQGNYYRLVKLGSTTSGSNYGGVNNIYSTSGFAQWRTVHVENDSDYEFTTEMRTGAEDAEFQRQFQYGDNPDTDGEADNDWFLFDAKLIAGDRYELRGWEDYFESIPTNVYSADTNYNWAFMPLLLLEGHGYKVSAGLQESLDDDLFDITGNCNLSITVERTTGQFITSNAPYPNNLLESPQIVPFMINCTHPTNIETIEQFRGRINGVDRKQGLVRLKYNGQVINAWLFEADLSREGKYKLIEAAL